LTSGLSFAVPTIHVWNANLSVSPKDLDRYWNVLSADERARAARFHFDIHRSRFVAGRGILRKLLGRYTRQDPVAIEFLYSSSGKPSLGGDNLHFNLAHSEDRAVFALTRIAPVGVDVECLRLIPEMMQIAERFFSPLEFKALSAIPDAQRNTAFFHYWTRKEAIVKASGKGLGSLDDFDDLIDVTAKRLAVKGDEAQRFFLYDLALSHEYIGAVACQRPCDSIALFQYDS
jgi:4'-phosphopantetheinyl transferase